MVEATLGDAKLVEAVTGGAPSADDSAAEGSKGEEESGLALLLVPSVADRLLATYIACIQTCTRVALFMIANLLGSSDCCGTDLG